MTCSADIWLAGLVASAVAAGAASAQPQSSVGTLGSCAVVATCDGAGDESCRADSGDQAVFSARVDGSSLAWVETDYSRFPDSDVNEETGFLPLTLLRDAEHEAVIGGLLSGQSRIEGTNRALFGHRSGRSDRGHFLDLYQFNPRGLIRHWRIDCPLGVP